MEEINYNAWEKAQTQVIKVLVVDDQRSICLLVKTVITTARHIQCVGVVQDGNSVIAQIETTEPDVVILDLELPGIDSIKLIQKIQNKFPELKVLILTIHREQDYVRRAIYSGAKGYILKGSPPQELIDAISAIYKGYTQFSQSILPDVLADTSSEADGKKDEVLWSEITRENLESLPLVSLRLLIYVLVVLFFVSTPWVFFSQFEEIAKVKGKITPQQKVTIIDAPISGKVQSVLVKEGQKVQANQTLLTFDSRLTSIEQQQQQHKLKTQQKRLNKLKALKKQAQKSLLILEAQSESEIAEKQAQITQTQTLIEAKNSELVEAKVNLEEANKKFQRYQKAVGQGALSIELVSEAQQVVKQENQNVIQAQTAIAEAESLYSETLSAKKILSEAQKIKAAEAQKELKQIESEILSVDSVDGEIAQIKNLISGLNYEAKSQIISSPIEGIIFDSTINKPGSVVESGESLISIAPKRSRLVFRGQILSKDVGAGFLKVGMVARIKLDSFPWREFGIVSGKISWISANSKQIDNQEIYEIEIEMNRHQNATLRNYLNFGQTGTAEVIVRKTNIINYVF
ncbi:MAG: response regulator [Waterburya sp.]